ncbi:unnamed protein product, partial [Larinioides sclopetarius]
MYSFYIFTVAFLVVVFSDSVNSLIDGLYCGKENCYSVLHVTREASKSEISKMYRQLAKKYHPDMHKTPVLKDEESRKDYDYMLDNPDKVYGHYYRYYRRRMSPKVDARIVIAVTITVISVIQDQIKEEHEEILKKILEEKIDIRGGYSKPTLSDVLWVQLICLPYTITKYVCWYVRWLWKFTVLKEEYGEEEKLYLIQRHLQCSQTQWEAIPDEEKEECFEQSLWIKENFLADENVMHKEFQKHFRDFGNSMGKSAKEVRRQLDAEAIELQRRSKSLEHELELKARTLCHSEEQFEEMTSSCDAYFENEPTEFHSLQVPDYSRQSCKEPLVECFLAAGCPERARAIAASRERGPASGWCERKGDPARRKRTIRSEKRGSRKSFPGAEGPGGELVRGEKDLRQDPPRSEGRKEAAGLKNGAAARIWSEMSGKMEIKPDMAVSELIKKLEEILRK